MSHPLATPSTTELMVSVRSGAEAALALAEGVRWLDVKEPSRGSLGAADPQTWQQIAVRLPHRTGVGDVRLSIALGEFVEVSGTAPIIPPRVDFIKVGLAGCATIDDWQASAAQWFEAISGDVQRVGVYYVDHHQAGSPKLEEVLEFAQQVGCGAVLVDTFDKRSGPLTQLWQAQKLVEFIDQVKSLGMLAVVGGSIRLSDLSQVSALGPDVIALRGAVCERDRTGTIVSRRIADCLRSVEASVAADDLED
ncbi:MAG: (5-formylfuran-3-yl)methyl phosphate synthase [Pirellulaceae bacterium]